METNRLGIDIGRVIIGGEGADSSFLDGDEAAAMRVPEIAGAFAAVAELARRFEGRVWLVSKCGPRIEARTRRWLDHRDFYAATGLSREHLRFCLKRPQKADHARALGLTHFIDDRADVLAALEGVVAHRFLFGPQRAPAPPGMIAVAGWAEVLALFREESGSAAALRA